MTRVLFRSLAIAFTLLLGTTASPLPAQEGAITGTVTQVETGEPLQNAQVLVVGTGLGTITDADGNFRITEVPVGEQSVRVRLVGYSSASEQVEVQAGQAATVRFRLSQSAVQLDQIVVTGTPGEQQMRSVGNAVSQMDVSEIQEVSPPPNIHGMLSSETPGLRVLDSAGEVGSGGTMQIRGIGSMTLSSYPLVYIDGVRVNNNAADHGGGHCGVGTDCGYPPSRINDLNPENIEQIEVIKGPAASTLYGTEASNGVINIITKKGQSEETRISLKVEHGATFFPNPEELFPNNYYRNDAGEIVEFNVLKSDRVTGQYPGDTISHGPWFRTGRPIGLSASISGGSEGAGYFFSTNYDRDEGPLPYNWQEKVNGRGNLTWTPAEALNIQFGVGGIRSELESGSAQQPLSTAIIWSCPAPGCEAGGGDPFAVDGPYRGYIAYLPERYEEDIEGFQDVDRLTLSMTARNRATDWLSQRLTVGADYTLTKNTELYRPIDGVGHFNPQGLKEVQNSTTRYYSLDYSATGDLNLTSDLTLSTSVGAQYYEKSQAWTYSQAEEFPVRSLETLGAGATNTVDENFLANKTLGVYVQERFEWMDRRYLTVAVRGDDNSAFGENFDFQTYPKVSASWVLTDEPALSDLDFLNTLKLRAAWGRSGNQPDVFAALRTYQPEIGPGGSATLSPENIGNPELRPEVGTELEAGFDASLLDERLSVEATYYRQETTDAIVQVPAAPSGGFPGNKFTNVGEVENSGIEVGVNATAVDTDPARLSARLTFSATDNEVVDVGDRPSILTSPTFSQHHVPGFPLSTIFMKRVTSADIEGSGQNARAVNIMCEGGERIPDTQLSAGGGSPVPCAEAPKVAWGSPVPTWEGAGSLTLTLFDRLRLFGEVDFVGGITKIDGDIAAAHLFFRNSRAILEREDPILLGYDEVGGPFGQAGIIDGGFGKLRTVSVNYRLPPWLLAPLDMDRATLTVSGRNLGTLWLAQEGKFGRKQLDPERGENAGFGRTPAALDAYSQEGWPQFRRFTAVLRLSF